MELQLLTGTAATLSIQFLDGEEPQTVTGSVAVTVVDDFGNTVATGTATAAVTGVGPFTFVLPPQVALGPLTATWTATIASQTWSRTTRYDVAGGFYFELDQLRERHGVSRDRFDDTTLAWARAWITSIVERVCRTSFVERFHREIGTVRQRTRVGDWDGLDSLLVTTRDPHPVSVVALSLDGVAYPNLGNLEVYQRPGLISVQGGLQVQRRVDNAYTACWPDGVPDDLGLEMVTAARWFLTQTFGNSAQPDRQIMTTDDMGHVVRLATASLRYPTGLPTVDAAISSAASRAKWPGGSGPSVT